MKKCGVLGFPVSHSLSPKMHQAAFDALGLDYKYELCEVKPEDLGCFMKRMASGEFAGLSVTIPHKESVMQYCAELTEDANEIGAVNTLYFKGEKLCGENTDWYGFTKSLEEDLPDFRDKSYLIFGAGGVARACLYGLKKEGVKNVFITNRTKFKGEKLAAEFGFQFVHPEDLPEADVLVNATSVGLKPDVALLTLEELGKFQVVFDLIYRDTELQIQAKKLGLKVITGLKMFLYQGAKQFELFTDKPPPIEVMRKTLGL